MSISENRAALRAVLERDLRGMFVFPEVIALTAADVAWFRRHARLYTQPVAPPRLLRGKEGECWRNAFRASVRDPSLHYVQGFVHPSHADKLVPHAWCVDDTGTLIELMWDVTRAMGGERYVGVIFTFEDLMALQTAFGRMGWYNGFAGVLGGDDDVVRAL
ncbi:MAG TPA: hypothetical protein VFB22_04980 [Candidatus Baltobacteraceae bacterium]|nr:hypothetical protein [Candidatus Baltobacteraceae bacterium]